MLQDEIDPKRGHVTTNHQTITEWVEKHDGHPATAEASDHSVGYLRIKFPNMDETDELATVSWREWLNEFEAEELAFVYPEQDDCDDSSGFYKLVDRTTAAEHA
jgi:hypothetical protein